MKPSDLTAGKTYVGKSGRRRHLIKVKIADIASRYPPGSLVAIYDVPAGGMRSCSASAFADWAEREATTEESAP